MICLPIVPAALQTSQFEQSVGGLTVIKGCLGICMSSCCIVLHKLFVSHRLLWSAGFVDLLGNNFLRDVEPLHGMINPEGHFTHLLKKQLGLKGKNTSRLLQRRAQSDTTLFQKESRRHCEYKMGVYITKFI